jgi:hypothetical protein
MANQCLKHFWIFPAFAGIVNEVSFSSTLPREGNNNCGRLATTLCRKGIQTGWRVFKSFTPPRQASPPSTAANPASPSRLYGQHGRSKSRSVQGIQRQSRIIGIFPNFSVVRPVHHVSDWNHVLLWHQPGQPIHRSWILAESRSDE